MFHHRPLELNNGQRRLMTYWFKTDSQLLPAVVCDEKCAAKFCFVFYWQNILLHHSEVIKEASDHFHSLATLPPEKAVQGPTYPLSSILGGPHSRSRHLGEQKKKHLAQRGF
jgi:hypothetical protein